MKKSTLLLLVLLGMYDYKIFAANFTLESPAFKLNTMIPARYTCNGDDQSPPLTWQNAPANTQSFTLVVEDPDAPSGVWTHWVLFNIPPTVTQLVAGSSVPEGSSHGQNSWGSPNYRGPCPPFGAHRYVFKLYALDTLLSLDNGATKDEILRAMTGHVIGSAELVGLYQK
ncbi:YbhB/YbcL family Raf kinase inhibitor-like protein [Legionella maioricensis]|uniref:YbhB/YbcL family Raf kinase inhibitor-like protein n=1 Tax=Legionella maioricensis TaxID=2896528 RepID=A0A9X2CZM9_9GAMM|nr:YbhB/YbcL family Raf kinase inhibitor-like protein [Legionella maioricensis]MCL9683671.1 YbhB/YbcL family Raf kinase inhibitor-like protein [Legionella maioricensis]MCL9687693.1 YbhB/YbcL family Raf kinase inhibitor-like protein [Legionella maioricensis]